MSNYDDEWEYTNKVVLKLLLNYWKLWAAFEMKSAPYNEGTRFSTPYSASRVNDGKGKARRKEDILCALVDVEEGLKVLHPSVRSTIMDYYINDTKDINTETERRYVHRCVQKLRQAMNTKRVDDGNDTD